MATVTAPPASPAAPRRSGIRGLWARVLELSGAVDAAGQVQHAVTSRAVLVETTEGRWHGHWRVPLGGRANGA